MGEPWPANLAWTLARTAGGADPFVGLPTAIARPCLGLGAATHADRSRPKLSNEPTSARSRTFRKCDVFKRYTGKPSWGVEALPLEIIAETPTRM
jgi:hypothetical protein